MTNKLQLWRVLVFVLLTVISVGCTWTTKRRYGDVAVLDRTGLLVTVDHLQSPKFSLGRKTTHRFDVRGLPHAGYFEYLRVLTNDGEEGHKRAEGPAVSGVVKVSYRTIDGNAFFEKRLNLAKHGDRAHLGNVREMLYEQGRSFTSYDVVVEVIEPSREFDQAILEGMFNIDG